MKITSYSEAVAITELSEKEIKSIEAYIQLCRITKALNDGWVPDWSNLYEYKYWVYSRYLRGFFSGGGAHFGRRCGLACAIAGNAPSYAYATIGSLLCFKSRELAEYSIANFPQLYLDLFMVDK